MLKDEGGIKLFTEGQRQHVLSEHVVGGRADLRAAAAVRRPALPMRSLMI
jgi:hypothetical protein